MKLSDVSHPIYFAVFPQGASITPRAHGIDMSKYDLFFEPITATGQLDFVIQRVSYRTTRDEAFTTLLPGVLSVPIRLGYHYLNSDRGWREQADAYLSFVAGLEYHAHICDFESAFNVMSVEFAYQAWQWIQYVAEKTGKKVLIYTSLNEYNVYLTPSQTKYYGINWNTVDYWQAQWFFTPNPNGTPTMPTSRTAGWKLWQYTSKGDGTIYGVARPTACDLNVFNGSVADMRAWLGLDAEEPTPPHGEYLKVRRYGSDCHVVIADLSQYDAQATNTEGALVPVSTAAKMHGGRIAINGDGWNLSGAPKYPLSIAASKGSVYQPVQYQFRPYINITADKRIEVANNKRTFFNTVSGTRYLVQAGVKSTALSGVDIVYVERHPRTAAGRRADGKLILAVVDGRSSASAGVTLSELADLMLEFGAVDALELDGGGSSAMWYGDRIVNVPSDGYERPVVNHLVLASRDEEIPMTGTAKEKLGKTVTIRKTPRVASGNSTNKSIFPYTTISFIGVVDDLDYPGNPNYKWLDLGNGEYANYIYPPNGLRFDILTQPSPDPGPGPQPDPSPLPVLTVEVTVKGAGYVTKTVSVDLEPE
jgi:GH25 family lysozyme M1 (1,4-beta-N-acetylmuramidase)